MTARSAAGAVRRALRRTMRRLQANAQLIAHPVAVVRVGWRRGLIGSYPAQAKEYRGRVLIFVSGAVGAAVLGSRRRRWVGLGLAVAGCLGGATRVGERRRRGSRRGWPPGHLTNLPEVALDRSVLRKAFARDGSVVKTSAGTRRVAAVLGLGPGARLLLEHRDRLLPIGYSFSSLVPLGFIRDMAPADHAHYRRVLASAFTPARTRAFEPVLTAAIDRSVAELLADDRPVSVTAWVEDVLFRAWFEVFTGVAPDDARYAWLREQYERFDWRGWVSAADVETSAFAAVSGGFRASVSAWESEAPEQWPDCVAATLLNDDPVALDDETLIGNLVILQRTSSADTHGLVKWVVHFLTQYPELRDRMRADLTTRAHGGDLSERIVSETLRLEQSEAVHRRLATDVSHNGYVLPKGWELRICVQESHRDETVFPDPDRFDPDRFRDHRYTRDQYAPFGLDNHSCIGESLARLAARLVAERLVLAADWVETDPRPTTFGEWRHWAPDSRWKIQLSARAAARPDPSEAAVPRR